MKYILFFVSLLIFLTAFSQQKKPNILFIIADDLTATAVSSYENKVCKTPNIDALASEGVRYTRAYCQYPVCGPSRASFMFGYYPNATTTFGYVSGREHIGPNKKTWAQLFKIMVTIQLV
jgi:arylsulfatase A-like enzyme